MKFLCIADLHLGKGGSYGRTPGERLAEQEAVWLQALEIGYERQVDAVLFAGDLFEGPIPLPEHYAAFTRPLQDWDGDFYPKPIIAINGNGRHDASTRDSNAVEVIGAIPGVYVHTKPAVNSCLLDGVAVATLPWVPVSRLVAAQDGGDRDEIHQKAAYLLVEAARGLRASADGPMILMTHFSVSGAAVPGGALTDQLREPVLPLGDLEAIGFDAIVAGHIHKPQVLSGAVGEKAVTGSATTSGDPVRSPRETAIFYTGSPMPLDFGEGGFDHGVWILDVDERGARAEFVPIESRRFVTLDENVYDLDEHDLAGAFVKAKRHLTEEQARQMDVNALKQELLARGAHNVWVELQVDREIRARLEDMDESIDDETALVRWIEANVDGDTDRLGDVLDLGTHYLEGATR